MVGRYAAVQARSEVRCQPKVLRERSWVDRVPLLLRPPAVEVARFLEGSRDAGHGFASPDSPKLLLRYFALLRVLHPRDQLARLGVVDGHGAVRWRPVWPPLAAWLELSRLVRLWVLYDSYSESLASSMRLRRSRRRSQGRRYGCVSSRRSGRRAPRNCRSMPPTRPPCVNLGTTPRSARRSRHRHGRPPTQDRRSTARSRHAGVGRIGWRFCRCRRRGHQSTACRAVPGHGRCRRTVDALSAVCPSGRYWRGSAGAVTRNDVMPSTMRR